MRAQHLHKHLAEVDHLATFDQETILDELETQAIKYDRKLEQYMAGAKGRSIVLKAIAAGYPGNDDVGGLQRLVAALQMVEGGVSQDELRSHGIGYGFDQAIRMLKAEGYAIESTERPAPGTMQVSNHTSGQTWRALSLSQLEELHVTSRNMVVWGVEHAYRITGRQIEASQTGA